MTFIPKWQKKHFFWLHLKQGINIVLKLNLCYNAHVAGVVQLVECFIANEKVAGSNPVARFDSLKQISKRNKSASPSASGEKHDFIKTSIL